MNDEELLKCGLSLIRREDVDTQCGKGRTLKSAKSQNYKRKINNV